MFTMLLQPRRVQTAESVAYHGYEEVEPSDEEAVGSKSKELHGTDVNQPLAAWLTKNVELARTRISACEPLRLANERRKDELIEMLGQDSFLLFRCTVHTLASPFSFVCTNG